MSHLINNQYDNCFLDKKPDEKLVSSEMLGVRHKRSVCISPHASPLTIYHQLVPEDS